MLCLFTSIAFSQVTIKGEILDESNGEPLIGANIVLKEEPSKGTITDWDGSFEIKVPSIPVVLNVSYIGYLEKDLTINSAEEFQKISLGEDAVTIDLGIEVTGQRVSDKQKAAPLTVETMDLLAIKETASENFYDGLGAMKGVDLTAASLGFKIINTRGFNSTSPVRSLQIIDGVDNQSPGLNFSLGNFLGSSDLDVLRVDMIQGASSAFYGPNAFNGVISMETKNPFYQKGLSAKLKVGERNLLSGAFRWADTFKNSDGNDWFGYKLNFFYLRADDWEADNFDPVYDTNTGLNNPGGYDAVNIYGDELNRISNQSAASLHSDGAGLGQYHRRGYKESDLVDYDTRNLKTNLSLHFRTKPSAQEKSPEFIIASNYSNGTTVYQGDNRFSLKNIQFFQNRLEFRKKGKYFIRAYATSDDAGDSYDPFFTALRLQDNAKLYTFWNRDYEKYWINNYKSRMREEFGYPELMPDPNGGIAFVIDTMAVEQWYTDFADSLSNWHANTQANANLAGGDRSFDFYEPGTARYDSIFNQITGTLNNEFAGTKFHSRSDLYHLHGEYILNPTFVDEWVVGANGRLYTPESKGTIFYDSIDIKITNWEVGAYTGLTKKFANDKLTASATIRIDKNENFDLVASPAASLVWKPKAGNFARLSFSSAIRNPTLSDQYLHLNVGPAILAGNLNGVDSLVTVNSFVDGYLNTLVKEDLEYFSIDAIQPEKVKSIEAGYRTTLFNSLYVDASYYYSVYDDFLGYNLGIDLDFNEDISDFPTVIQAYRYASNSKESVNTQGFAIGLNYYFADYYQVSGNYSWNRLNSQVEDPIIPAFNTPEHKYNLGFSGRSIPLGRGLFGFNVNYKWIEGFLFEGSPQFTGLIPSYDLIDVQINYFVKKMNTTFKLGASNILDNKQFQAYGGPRIGRLAYLSATYDFKKK